MKSYVLSIDPSINNLGWAIFYKKKLKKYGMLHPDLKSADYMVKCREMIIKLKGLCKDIPGGMSNMQIVVEVPDHFATAGFMSRESGAVQKLTFLAGMIYNMQPDVVGYFPRVWKGNLKKHTCALRLAKIDRFYSKIMLGDKPKIEYCSDCDVQHPKIILRHDTIDAIGIGHKYIWGKI